MQPGTEADASGESELHTGSLSYGGSIKIRHQPKSNNMLRGYVKLYRSVWDCSALKEKDKKFSKLEAWLYIVNILASGIDTDDKKRGEFDASYRYMAKAWRWSLNKTYRFISTLIAENMLKKVEHQIEHQIERLIVCNYDTYNPKQNAKQNTKQNKLNKGFNESKNIYSKTVPEDFDLSEELMKWTKSKRSDLNIGLELEKFKNHLFPKAHTDWNRAWKNWILNTFKYDPPKEESGPQYKKFDWDDFGGKPAV